MNSLDLKILFCGFGYTAQNFVQYFPCNYRILGRKPSHPDLQYESNFLPDIVIDSIPPVYDEFGQLQNPLHKKILLDLYNKKKFVYVHISSTSVYPNIEKTFNEKSTIPYFHSKGKERWQLEENILDLFPFAFIIRAGGIYGKGRNLVLTLKQKKWNRLPRENKIVYRIHVYDLCQIILYGARNIQEKGIEVSIFPGYQRNNIIIAIEPESFLISEVIQYIEDRWNISIPPMNLNTPICQRKLQSLYASSLIQFRYPNFQQGFKELDL